MAKQFVVRRNCEANPFNYSAINCASQNRIKKTPIITNALVEHYFCWNDGVKSQLSVCRPFVASTNKQKVNIRLLSLPIFILGALIKYKP